VKFLVIWKLELSLVPRGGLDAVLRMPDYAAPLESSGKIAARYHIVGAHGGAWIYDVDSNESSSGCSRSRRSINLAHYDVYPLGVRWASRRPDASGMPRLVARAGRMIFRSGLRAGGDATTRRSRRSLPLLRAASDPRSGLRE
jgi:hypothetical protein